VDGDGRGDVFCVTNMSILLSVVGEWNLIVGGRWKDTDKRGQNCLREAHLCVILSGAIPAVCIY
jgi:hypothetical protein